VSRTSARTAALILAAFALGLAIAYVDTRPTWDDTGITAGVVVAGSALATMVGLRPWWAAACVAGPLALVLAVHGSLAAVVVALLGLAGGAIGSVVRPRWVSWV
jgi:hypothetical protein